MSSSAYTNLFPLALEGEHPTLYRAPRVSVPLRAHPDYFAYGPYLVADKPSHLVSEAFEPEQGLLKQLVHRKIAGAISRSSRFFDVSSYSLSATIAGALLHKQETFSIAQAFALQVLFDEAGLYLAVLPELRLYNRLKLPEVMTRLGPGLLQLPRPALCFAGGTGEERWRDCRLLAVSPEETCIVRVYSLEEAEISLPASRVIPKLGAGLIQRMVQREKPDLSVAAKLKALRREGQMNEGKTTAERSLRICSQLLAPLFPLRIGQSRVGLVPKLLEIQRLSATLNQERIEIRTCADGASRQEESIRAALAATECRNVRDQPVVLFCTRDSETQLQGFIEELNRPSRGPGGFAGLPQHFGLRLSPVERTPIIVDRVDQYEQAVRDYMISPSTLDQNPLALIVLSDSDEPYTDPVPLYYRLKALLASGGFPSQVLEKPTLRKPMALWNVALNLAAKLERVPWTLADARVLAPAELFLGFSYSSVRTEELGLSRNIGYVNVFDRSGVWQVLCADASPFSFEERLKTFPRLAADAVRSATSDPKSLRFIEVHYNKRFGFRERRAIVEGIRSVASKAAVLFVSIDSHHPVRLIDERRPESAAQRGWVISMGDDVAFLQSVNGSAQTGLPHPLRVQIYRDFCSFPESMPDVCRRLLALTRLNWRSVQESASSPVTILYSSLVARLTNYFNLSHWRSFVDHHLKRTPWFL